MSDRNISVGCAVAAVLWVAVVLLIGAAWMLDHRYLGFAGLACSAAAATAQIRQYHVLSNRLVREAFDYGREVGAMRSVR